MFTVSISIARPARVVCSIVLSSVALNLAAAGAAYAQRADPLIVAQSAGQTAAQSEAIVVTANRAARPVSETLSDITVISRRDIADAGASTLPELLQSFGGLEISQNGGAGKVSGLFVRGTRTAQTVILVDGVRLENPLSGGGNLEFLPISSIDRIEVLRGPSSSLYGSGAVGGVIQIFTRQGEGPLQSNGSISLGTQSTRLFNVGVSGRIGEQGNTSVALAYSADRTAGYEATTPGSSAYQADRDGNRQSTINASLQHRLNQQWSIGGSALSTNGRTYYDDAFSTPDTARFRFASRALSAYLSGKVTPAWETTLRFGQTRVESSYDAFLFEPKLASNSWTWQNNVNHSSGKWLFGYEQMRQSIAGEGVTSGTFAYLRDHRNTRSWFAGYEAATGAHLWRVNARNDSIDELGGRFSGSLGYGYRLANNSLLRASYGTAFRAPTFDDLYSPFGSNSLLRPERATGFEFAYEQQSGPSLFKATAFVNRVRSAIELDNNFIPQNIDAARVRGLTLEARQDLGAVRVRGNLTVQSTSGATFDSTTNEAVVAPLSRRARQFGTLAADWRSGPMRYTAQWVFQGERYDQRQRLGSYGLVNLWAVWALSKENEIALRAGNVFDRQSETALGYNGVPRNLLLSWRSRF